MIFQTVGNKENPAVLFFHAMGATGESSRPVAASSLGADLACAFLAETKLRVRHVFFDGGQFAQIGSPYTGYDRRKEHACYNAFDE